jgi:hypothetical protein
MFCYKIVVTRVGCTFCGHGLCNNIRLRHQITAYVTFTNLRVMQNVSQVRILKDIMLHLIFWLDIPVVVSFNY